MLTTVIAGILTLGAVGSVLAGGVYFYWRLADRRLTDIDERQKWFKENYKGDISLDQLIQNSLSIPSSHGSTLPFFRL